MASNSRCGGCICFSLWVGCDGTLMGQMCAFTISQLCIAPGTSDTSAMITQLFMGSTGTFVWTSRGGGVGNTTTYCSIRLGPLGRRLRRRVHVTYQFHEASYALLLLQSLPPLPLVKIFAMSCMRCRVSGPCLTAPTGNRIHIYRCRRSAS